MRVRRGDLGQVHVKEGHATVLQDNQSIVLSDVATTIFMAVSPSSWTPLDEITDTVVTKLGPPEPPLEAEELVRGLVLELVEQGLLTVVDASSDTFRAPRSDEVLRAALRHVVSRYPEEWMPSSPAAASDLLAAAQRHRVTSVLSRARSRLVLPRPVEEKIDTIYRQESAAIRLLERELVEATQLLAGSGVRVVAFEGLPLAVQAHGHVTARGTDDHDLLVSPHELEDALEVLTALGWRVGTGFPSPAPTAEWQGFVRDFSEIVLTRRGHAVDLHWRLDAADDADEAFDALWSRRVPVEIGTSEVSTLSSYDALVHAVGRVTTNQPMRFRDLLDVWQLAAQPGTWEQQHHALDPAGLQVIGEAMRAFGTPSATPAEVQHAARLADSA